MSRVVRTTAVRHAVFKLALAGLAMASIGSANASDLYPPAIGIYPPAVPTDERVLERDRYYGVAPLVHRPVEFGAGICRIFHERRVDPYGRETIHRIRMCDDGPIYGAPSGALPPPDYGYPRPYYEHSGYYSRPRPPLEIGQGYYEARE
jgi:hypothetical protein